jgi:hypothetical protein
VLVLSGRELASVAHVNAGFGESGGAVPGNHQGPLASAGDGSALRCFLHSDDSRQGTTTLAQDDDGEGQTDGGNGNGKQI